MCAIDPRSIARREFLRRGGVSLGSIALLHLLGRDQADASLQPEPRAKNVIFLFMAGGPSQFELFEPKDTLQRLDGQPPPASLTSGKRFAFIDPGRAKLMGTDRAFARHGDSGAPVSELLPQTAGIVDELCFLRGLTTNEINHGPAKLFMNTGFGQFGRPEHGRLGHLRDRKRGSICPASSCCSPAREDRAAEHLCGATAFFLLTIKVRRFGRGPRRCSTSRVPRASTPTNSASSSKRYGSSTA